MDGYKKAEFNRIRRQMKQTAAERYAEHRRDIFVLIDLLREELDVHAKEATKHSDDWGLAGDLGHIRRLLKDAILFLITSRFESQTEASGFIEDYIDTGLGRQEG